jgi:hypothetical protein
MSRHDAIVGFPTESTKSLCSLRVLIEAANFITQSKLRVKSKRAEVGLMVMEKDQRAGHVMGLRHGKKCRGFLSSSGESKSVHHAQFHSSSQPVLYNPS